ncbi:MAG: type II secretion system ATPase GspE [Aeromonas sp.]
MRDEPRSPPTEPRPLPALPFVFARNFGVILIERNHVPVLLCRPDITAQTLLEVRRVAGCSFTLEPLDTARFDAQLMAHYQRDSSKARQLMEDLGHELDFFTLADALPRSEDLLDANDDAPIIRLINAMLSEAIKEEASDIHIETFERVLVIRFRIDGVLREILRPHRKLASLLVSRIKVMARMDIAEKRLPQDGRISLTIGGRAVDVRVSTMPSSYGERVVLRLLDKNHGRLELTQLGMTANNRTLISELIQKPHGIILVTGPTGSGKSTTLYAALSEINARDRNILTVEDPIEYDLEGVGQTQVNSKVDMTFARGLRAILRQDPDVVMVGEIRDLDTARIAVQASLTGHLVMSTLHTNTAIGAITRLRDIGVEPFLLSSSLLAVLAQRLVRTLCCACRAPHPISDAERQAMGIERILDRPLWHPVGCPQCNHSGYRGRTAIHELVIINDAVREAIHNASGELAIARLIRSHTPSIRRDGIDKVLKGQTSLEEVLRVTQEDSDGGI